MENRSTVILDNEVEIAKHEFTLEKQDFKLDNLPRYEDLITTSTTPEGMQEAETVPLFETKKKKDVVNPNQAIYRKRFKIALGVFSIVTVLLLTLVVANAINLLMLTQTSKKNQEEISALTEEVEIAKDVDLSGTTLVKDGADKVGYKLAIPRNYPENSADLTWLDKISIVLMKILG